MAKREWKKRSEGVWQVSPDAAVNPLLGFQVWKSATDSAIYHAWVWLAYYRGAYTHPFDVGADGSPVEVKLHKRSSGEDPEELKRWCEEAADMLTSALNKMLEEIGKDH